MAGPAKGQKRAHGRRRRPGYPCAGGAGAGQPALVCDLPPRVRAGGHRRSWPAWGRGPGLLRGSRRRGCFLQLARQREGQPYRLPGIGELVEFYSDAASEGVTPGIWQADAERNPPDCVAHDSCFSEWTRETLEEPVYGTGIVRVSGSIFYPPWLREGTITHIQAHMLASEGYSFISFRIPHDAGRG